MKKVKRVFYTLYMRYAERKITFPVYVPDGEDIDSVVVDILMQNRFLEFDSLEETVVSEIEFDCVV